MRWLTALLLTACSPVTLKNVFVPETPEAQACASTARVNYEACVAQRRGLSFCIERHSADRLNCPGARLEQPTERTTIDTSTLIYTRKNIVIPPSEPGAFCLDGAQQRYQTCLAQQRGKSWCDRRLDEDLIGCPGAFIDPNPPEKTPSLPGYQP